MTACLHRPVGSSHKPSASYTRLPGQRDGAARHRGPDRTRSRRLTCFWSCGVGQRDTDGSYGSSSAARGRVFLLLSVLEPQVGPRYPHVTSVSVSAVFSLVGAIVSGGLWVHPAAPSCGFWSRRREGAPVNRADRDNNSC